MRVATAAAQTADTYDSWLQGAREALLQLFAQREKRDSILNRWKSWYAARAALVSCTFRQIAGQPCILAEHVKEPEQQSRFDWFLFFFW